MTSTQNVTPGPERSYPASERQVGYLRSLAGERAIFGRDVGREETITMVEEIIQAGPTGAQVSALINQARQSAQFAPAERPVSPWRLDALRRYAQEKAIFGLTMTRAETAAQIEEKIQAGLNEQDAAALCMQAYMAKPHPTEKSALPLHLVEGIDGLTISEGHYAVMYDGALRFYRIYTAPSGEHRGKVVMKRFASSNLIALYPGEAKTVLTEIDADPDAAAYRFADEFTLCWVCAKQLTDAVSRLLSVGPVCRGFHQHTGLRDAATAVDTDKTRRLVFRALRQWALDQGFTDPRSKEQRKAMSGQMTASRLASAWSGLPGLLGMGSPEEVVALVQQTINGTLSEPVKAALLAAPSDTVMILLDSGVLTGPVLRALQAEHPSEKIRNAAGLFFLTLMGG